MKKLEDYLPQNERKVSMSFRIASDRYRELEKIRVIKGLSWNAFVNAVLLKFLDDYQRKK